MFRFRPVLVLVALAAVVVAGVATVSVVSPAERQEQHDEPPQAESRADSEIVPGRLFTGDYSTGDFLQWGWIEAGDYVGSPSGYPSTYSATVIDDATYGKAARFEVRSGDIPFGNGERAEVGEDAATTGGTEGQVRCYRFATKFDPTFPQNHADLGWAVTNQWHQDSEVGSPLLSWSPAIKNGYWSLTITKQSAPGDYLDTFSIFDTPLAVGQWHDVTMQVRWSTSDTEGWIRLWLNGIRQTFVNGADTYFVGTLIPGTTTVYYKEGYYRKPMSPTGIVYHTGFRCAETQEALRGKP
jgi:hypothetical protein